MKRYYQLLLISIILIFIWSAWNPFDRFTWWLEVTPAIIAFVLLLGPFRKYHLTPLVYTLIFFHAIILLVGGHYTYALNPLFNTLQETFDLSRNYYDRLGHFFQGFTPAIVAREIILRNTPLTKKNWINFIIISITLAISALYELLEFIIAKILGSRATDFLGTQGDIWDTQWDMLMALIGAMSAIIVLSRLHDRQLHKYTQK